MFRDLIKWVLPGTVIVLCGTPFCVAMTAASIDRDISSAGRAALQRAGHAWADVAVQNRNLFLSGLSTDEQDTATALRQLLALQAVRSVFDQVALAPAANPFAFKAEATPEGVKLSGGVPDQTTGAQLLSRAELQAASLEIRSGMPQRETWLAGAQFAVENAKHLDQGEISLSDTTLSLRGRAKSSRDYRDLHIIMRAGPPAGLTLGTVEIVPPLVAPYTWSAQFDGKRITISGTVPDQGTAERLRTAELSAIALTSKLVFGSGEPEGFSELSDKLLQQLAKLEYGTATIIDGESRLTGAPPSEAVAQAVVDTLRSSNSIVVLEAPRIDDYWTSATLQPGGVIVFDGYAPDDETRDAFAAVEGADVNYLKLGRGAPDVYQAGTALGLRALKLMSEGRVSLREDGLSVSGIARSSADYEALMAMLSEGLTAVELAAIDIKPPVAANYEWTATKASGGVIALSGFVPDAAAREQILEAAGPAASEDLTYAAGAQTDFVASTQVGLELLQQLEDGRIGYDGSGWILTGTPRSEAARAAIEQSFTTQQLAGKGWSMSLAQLPASPQVEPPSLAVEEPAPPASDPMKPTAASVAEATPPPSHPVAPQREEIAPPAAERSAAVTEAPAPAETEKASAPLPDEPAPATAPPVANAPTPPSPQSDITACTAPVAQFSARNAIFFRPGAAAIAAESSAALDELAIDLAACPDATVHIEGHTDSDGEAGRNMALSVARAEAVIAALVERGVSASRLYAVGYGETKPIADNATPEGKRINRRIVVTVQPGR
ncbi:MAG TPA: OmpA family protein [Devosia sp.]|jgi:outer membrane protein OmpA-like peptidoglycan-associated protein/osmotically-inducible protein OsmY|uniref:OmpA family protein n=1 Tax=Devosia sp. TaxID=1871048 RepID=UPI002F922C23